MAALTVGAASVEGAITFAPPRSRLAVGARPRPFAKQLIATTRAAVCAVCGWLAGCQGGGAAQPPASAPTRVVSLHDVTTELVVALGQRARLVGIEAPVDLTPAVVAQVSDVARVSGIESILAQRPQWVLGLSGLAERDPELVARLREAGIAVQLAQPAKLDDVYALTRAVAQQLGVAERGETLVSEMREQLPSLAEPTRPARVFVYDCCDPPFTAGGKSVLSDLIAHAGGRNVFAELETDWTHVAWEEVVARKPELIVVHAYHYDGQGDAGAKQRALQAVPGLAGVPTAVLPLGCSLGGLRSAEGLMRLRAALQGKS